MKKLLIICSIPVFCFNFSAYGQKRLKNIVCIRDTITAYRYGFSPYKAGYKSYSKITPSQFGSSKKIISFNQSLVELFSVALGAGNTFPSNRIIIEVREPDKLNKKQCYELIVPPYLYDDMFVIMHQNLQYQYPEYIASVVEINGSNWLKIADKEEGILLNPVAKNENTTY